MFLLEAATGVALSKMADLAQQIFQSSPVVKIVSAAMVDLRQDHKPVHTFIIGDDATTAFRAIAEELEALEQHGTAFDPKMLATKLRQRGDALPKDFDQGVEFLCQCLKNRVQEHPSLAGKYHLNVLEGIQTQLDSLQQLIPVAELNPSDIMATCKELSVARLDRFRPEYGDVPAWEDRALV